MSTQEKEVKVPIEINYDNLKSLVDSGKTKEEIGKAFNLNAFQTSKLMTEAKLRVKKQIKPAFILVKPSIIDENEIPEVTTKEAKKEKAEKVTKLTGVAVEKDPDLLQVTNKVEETSTDMQDDW